MQREKTNLAVVFLTLLALLVGAPAPPPAAHAAAPTAAEKKAVVLAAKYYRSDKRKSFSTQAKRLPADSVYQPIIAYWQAIMALRSDKPEATEQYIATAASPYFQGQARRRLLEYAIKKKQWARFKQHADEGGDCSKTMKALLADTEVREPVRALWHADSKMTQELCLALYRTAHRKGILTKEHVWTKIRALAGDRQLGATRRLLGSFPGFVAYRDVRSVVRRATRYIQGKHGLNTRAQRELVMISAMVAARKNPKTAIKRWRAFSKYFTREQNDHVWTVLATWAARWHRDDALKLYGLSTGKYANEQSRAWRVRAAMRAGDFAQVKKRIEAMPGEESGLSAWRYWHAIALQQEDAAAAQAALQSLARDEDDYYGLLAREAVGMQLVDSQPPPPQLPPINGDFELALALYDAGLNSLARAVWRSTARRSGIDPMELIAAAEAAAKVEWPLASIDAAIRADHAAAHHWRFPFLYEKTINPQSEKRGLDLAFVYGLIHQESRFMPKIVSSAKARGLMQVIPSTARSVARANKYTKYKLSRLTRVDTNVIIGTTYLRELADDLDAAPAMVAAAYNAGPTRVRRWYRASPQILVAIENIPITETRLYVKYLLANRMHYQERLGRELPTMRENIARPILTTI